MVAADFLAQFNTMRLPVAIYGSPWADTALDAARSVYGEMCASCDEYYTSLYYPKPE